MHVALVTPVLDDWESFGKLLTEMRTRFFGSGIVFHVLAVDDGSSQPFDPETIAIPAESCIADIEILHLAVNLGHQRAIAVGLCAVAARDDIDDVVVLDCDGEDRPIDMAALFAAGERQPRHIVFARREERSETRMFKLGYLVYKLVFRTLTGKVISFGNYSLLPMSAVRRLVRMPELWNNLPAAVMRSRLPYTTVPTTRGNRYAGKSRMNFVSLMLHGLSAMSVYTDLIFIRALAAAAMIAGMSVLGIMVVVAVRMGTALAIPGWATTTAGILLIVFLQTAVVMVATTLLMLAGRSNRQIMPMVDSEHFISSRQSWLAPVGRNAAEAVPLRVIT